VAKAIGFAATLRCSVEMPAGAPCKLPDVSYEARGLYSVPRFMAASHPPTPVLKNAAELSY
jgi:hypothetical protein